MTSMDFKLRDEWGEIRMGWILLGVLGLIITLTAIVVYAAAPLLSDENVCPHEAMFTDNNNTVIVDSKGCANYYSQHGFNLDTSKMPKDDEGSWVLTR